MLRLSLFVNAQVKWRALLMPWLDLQEGRIAILTAAGHDIAALHLPHPVFTDVGVIPLESSVEERIHRDVHLHRRTLVQRLEPWKYQGISFANDLTVTINPQYESVSRLAHAAERLFAAGYDHVIVMLQHFSYFHLGLFHAAKACGLTREGDVPLQIRGDAVIAPCYPADLDIDRYIDKLLGEESLDQELSDTSVQSPQMEPGGVLVMLTTSEQLYTDCIAEVIRELQRRSIPYRAIVYDAETRGIFRARYEIESTVLVPIGEEYRLPEDRTDLLESLRGFLLALKEDVVARTTRPVIADATSLPLVILDFADACCFLEDFYTRLIQFAIRVNRLDDLFALQQPASVYCPPATTPLESAVVQVAHKYDIPTINSVFNAVSTEYRSVVRSCYLTDYITVLGEDQIPVFVACGFDRSLLVPIGQPDLDPVRKMWTSKQSQSYLRELFPNFDDTKQTVLIAMSSGAHATDIPWLEAACEHVQARGDLQILYKVHPSRNPAPFIEFATRRPDLPLILGLEPDKRIHPYLGAASLVITNTSHTGTLAVYHQLPLIAVNFTGKPHPHIRYDEEGVAILATSDATLHRAIDSLLSDSPERAQLFEAHQSFLRRKLTSNDGHAAGRLVDLLLSAHRATRTISNGAKMLAR